jgi:hypothetical protein
MSSEENNTNGGIEWAPAFTPELAREEIEDSNQGGSQDFIKFPEGDTVIRVIRPLVGMNLATMRDGTQRELPYVKSYQHYFEIPGQQSSLKFNCARLMNRELCPVCVRMDELSRTGNPSDRGIASKLYPRMRVYYNVIQRSDEEYGPKILAAGKMVHQGILNLFDPVKGGDMTDPENGFDIIVTRVGTGEKDTKYTVSPSRQNTSLGNYEWAAMQHDLTRLAALTDGGEIADKLALIMPTASLRRGPPPLVVLCR